MRIRLSLEQKVGAGFGAALLTLAAVGAVSCASTRRAIDQEALVADGQEYIRQLEEVVGAVKDAETGERGYVLTRSTESRRVFEDGLFFADRRAKMTCDQSSELYKTIQSMIAFMRRVVQAVDSESATHSDGARRLEATGQGDRLMRTIRDDAQAVQFNFQSAANDQLAEAEKIDQRTFAIIAAGYTGAFAIVLLSFLFARRDMARRRATEAALADTEQRFRTAISSMNEGLLLRSRDGDVQFWNPSLESILGISCAALVGAEPRPDGWRCTHEDGTAFTDEDLPTTAAVRTGKPLRGVVMRVRRGDGTVSWVSVNATPLFRTHQEFAYASVGTFVDITEQRRAQEELREYNARLEEAIHLGELHAEKLSEERHLLHTLMDTVPDCIYFKNRESRFLRNNRAHAKVFGFDHPSALVGKSDFDFFTGEHADQAYEDEQELMRTGRPVLVREERETWPDGRVTWVSSTKMLLRDTNGQIIGTFGISRDITERKQAEAELRTATEEAEAASRAKSEFLANMSHEIRTPMNGVLGMISLLLDTDLAPEQHEFARTVQSSATALLDILNDILDYSKIEAGKLDLESVPFDLRHVVDDVVGLLFATAQKKNLELASVFNHDVPTALVGDAGRIRQILTNLVGNAIKFTPTGEVTVRTSLVDNGLDTALVKLEVTDTGIGFSDDTRGRLFKSFSQADGSTTRRFGGTGLGLAISKQLVELMSGEIGVESYPGRGSAFWFTVPFSRQATSAGQVTREDFDDLRVLIVDDNATNCLVLREQMKPWGCRIEEAASGAEALSMLTSAVANDPFKLILLDMQMPDRDGDDTARLINSDPRFRGIPIILISSMGVRSPAEAAASGFAASLNKPVRQSTLFETVAGVLESTAVERPRELRESDAAIAGASSGAVDLGLHALLAEDNEVNIKVATRLLERWGCRVDAVKTGWEAVECHRARVYDVVLMDVQMPEMDGYEATEAIRGAESASGAHVPIIAMTAHAMARDRDRCLEVGMDDHIAKPVDPDALLAALRRWARPRTQLLDVEDEQPVAAPSEVINRDRLSKNCGDDPEFERHVLEVLTRTARAALDRIRSAAEDRSASAVEDEAHGLAGSCGTLGADALGAAFRTLEQIGRGGDLAEVCAAIDRAQRELTRFCAAVDEVLSTHGDPGEADVPRAA